MTNPEIMDLKASQAGPPLSGLSDAEAAQRLRMEGYNELPRTGQRTFARILIDLLREPMLAMLIGAGLIYMALRDLTSPRALVIRDGVRKRIAGREVARGDLVVLAEGDRVPADGWIAENDGLYLDESLLTGESVAVRKTACGPDAPTAMARPGGDDLPFVYSGSLVVRGTGYCVVTATGLASEIGRIGRVLSTLETEAPRLRQQTRRLILWFAATGAAASVLVVLLYGLFRGSWLEATLAGIALGMSMLPEEFPVVLTIFMAMGAMRMSRNRVLTRRAAAIETLGAATMLCTDKTGTLTQNRMRIAELRLPDGRILLHDDRQKFLLQDEFHLLAELGILASAQQPVDPMEAAFHELGEEFPSETVSVRQDVGWKLELHYPLAPDLLAMSHVWANRDADEERIIATKGAPEAIAELCGISGDERAKLKYTIDAMASKGLRVLGVADARWSGVELPKSQREFGLTFRGLVGLADPLRSSVPDAVRQCREAGIRIIMITGDYPQTARAIAQEAGIDSDELLTGEELTAMSDDELRQRIGSVSVCARVMPEQKLRLVEALKKSGEIVAMTATA